MLITSNQIVTCAHVVNMALDRELLEQVAPGDTDLVQVSFPRLPGSKAVRLARVTHWVPPPQVGTGGGDIAGLELNEDAPSGVKAARFEIARPQPGTVRRVFGYPGVPPREQGSWVDVDLKGEVGEQLIQVESRGGQTVKAQPGYSGSPVWDDSTGRAVGLLQVAPFADRAERDAYLLPPRAIAEAWEEPFDYLLVPANPYRGLKPFTADDEAVFFGRDRDIDDLTALVNAQPAVVVVGPSGVGKSSLVQAGLIPRLQRQRQWSVALVRPGLDPWQRLATGLLEVQGVPAKEVTLEQAEGLITRLRGEGLGFLARFLRSKDRGLLVVVDQLEELLAAGKPQDQGLIDLLLPQPDAVEDAARVVLTLRTDFLPALQSTPNVQLNGRIYLLSPLTAEQTRQAVERPAAERGVMFLPGLADEIVRDAAGGALPLLEFALTRLWATQRRRTLTFEDYRAMGGIVGVLDQVAEEQVAVLPDAVADRLDRVLIRLVRLPADGSGLATRQRVLECDVTNEEWQVLQRLADARLTSIDADLADNRYAELTHESLITAWQRLRDLVTGNRDFLTWLARMELRVREKDRLPEERIPEAQHWLSTRPGDVPDTVSRFVQNSVTAAEARIRELSDARDRAEKAREQAEASANRAEALRLAAEAETALYSAHPAMVIALALSTESVLTVPTMQGDLALRHVLRLHPRTFARLDHEGVVNAVAFSPDGTRIATASNRSARVFDVVTGEQLAGLDHEGAVNAVAFSPDGTRIATASGNEYSGLDGAARVFDVVTGEQLAGLDHEGAVNAVAFGPDGTRIATASNRSARVFDVVTGEQLAGLDHEGVVNAVAFSPDGTRIATASDEIIGGAVRVFDAATGWQLAGLDHEGVVNAVAFSPDGTRIATASGNEYSGLDGAARVFDVVTGEQLAGLDHEGAVNAVAFSPDGTRIATASGNEYSGLDGAARVFDVVTGEQLARLDHEGAVNAVAFSPDGTRIATASGDGSTRVFDATVKARSAWLDLEGVVNAVAFSPDGTRIAIASNRSARVFDVVTGEQLAGLDHEGAVNAVAFSPDGTRIATASGELEDGSARVFDVVTGEQLARLDHEGAVNAVAFSPDGTRIATASRNALGSVDGALWVFDAATGDQLARADHKDRMTTVAFCPDGVRIATASESGASGTVWVFDAMTGEQLARLDHEGAVNAVAFSPDGTRIATASRNALGPVDGALWLFDVVTGDQLAWLDHEGAVNAAAFSPDGTGIATASRNAPGSVDGVLCVFDAMTGEQLARADHEGTVKAVTFSPDGTRIATASESGASGAVWVFDAMTGEQLARADHEGTVKAVTFSPDGTRIATASESGASGAVWVFDAMTGEQLARLDHEGTVKAVTFSPDGTRIATVTSNFAGRVFGVTPELLVQRAFDVMTRPLSPAELRRYSLHADCRHIKEWIRQGKQDRISRRTDSR